MEQTLQTNETVYTYQHKSGEFVTVGNFEEALGRCAYLGAETTTPEEAKLAWNLYARGVQKEAENAEEEKLEQENEIDDIDEQVAEESENNTLGENSKPRESTQKEEVSNEDKRATNHTAVREDAKQESPLRTAIENTELIDAASTNSPIAEHGGSPKPNVSTNTESEGAQLNIEDNAVDEQRPMPEESKVTEVTEQSIDETDQQLAITEQLDELIQEMIDEENPEALQPLQNEISETVLINEEEGFEQDITELSETTDDNPTFEIPLIEEVRPAPEDIELAELSTAVEDVEQIMLSVDERLQELAGHETEESEQLLTEVNEILEEIQAIIQPDQLPAADAAENSKELFAQLFKKLGIEYTPDLLDACVKFAGSGELNTAEREQDEEESLAPTDSGTHEILKQIITAATNLKRVIWHAYMVGRLACCYLWPPSLQLSIRVIK